MTDEDWMRRALYLATRGRGTAEPNPSVGCVIVKHGRAIGEGFTQPFGGAHAEPTALANCTESPEGATAYVTLEPCCHTNKKTPPCAPRVIAAGIKRVVIGALDPNPDVNGKGVAMLRAAGVQVDGPLLEAEAKQAIAPFIKSGSNQPYVTLKWAQTVDNKIAGPGSARLQISNSRSTRIVHGLRARSDAILVGINTVLTDDPMLTAREVPNPRPLLRFVLDSQLLIPTTARLVRSAAETPVVVACRDGAYASQHEQRLREFVESGVFFVTFPDSDQSGISLHAFFLEMFTSDILEDVRLAPVTHLLVEPGPTLAASFFRDNLCDRLWVFRSPKVVNDPTAPAAAVFPSNFVETGRIDIEGDTLVEYLNPDSPVFFAAVPSADFVVAGESAAGAARFV